MPLVEKASVEPVCRKLLADLLAYAIQSRPDTPGNWESKDIVSMPIYRDKGYVCADLRTQHNRNFREEIATNKLMFSGWAVPRLPTVNDLPTGKVTYEDVPFDLVDPKTNGGKNCIALHAVKSPYAFKPTPFIQDKAKVKMSGHFSHLYFLHALSYNWTSEDYGRYVIGYRDGTKEVVPLNGTNIAAWPQTPPRPLPLAKPVWRGIVPGPEEATVYLFDWANPVPEKAIETVEFAMDKSTAIPVLIAITGREIELER